MLLHVNSKAQQWNYELDVWKKSYMATASHTPERLSREIRPGNRKRQTVLFKKKKLKTQSKKDVLKETMCVGTSGKHKDKTWVWLAGCFMPGGGWGHLKQLCRALNMQTSMPCSRHRSAWARRTTERLAGGGCARMQAFNSRADPNPCTWDLNKNCTSKHHDIKWQAGQFGELKQSGYADAANWYMKKQMKTLRRRRRAVLLFRSKIWSVVRFNWNVRPRYSVKILVLQCRYSCSVWKQLGLHSRAPYPKTSSSGFKTNRGL